MQLTVNLSWTEKPSNSDYVQIPIRQSIKNSSNNTEKLKTKGKKSEINESKEPSTVNNLASYFTNDKGKKKKKRKEIDKGG